MFGRVIYNFLDTYERHTWQSTDDILTLFYQADEVLIVIIKDLVFVLNLTPRILLKSIVAGRCKIAVSHQHRVWSMTPLMLFAPISSETAARSLF